MSTLRNGLDRLGQFTAGFWIAIVASAIAFLIGAPLIVYNLFGAAVAAFAGWEREEGDEEVFEYQADGWGAYTTAVGGLVGQALIGSVLALFFK